MVQRYTRDAARYALAVRMIRHETRTHTIQQWTKLSEQCVRNLCQSHKAEQGQRSAVRHRGPSPWRAGFFFYSAHRRNEAAALAGLCYALEVIPLRPVENARRELPGVRRGERACLAFEMYRSVVPISEITLEHTLLLVTSLAQGGELQMGCCAHCGAAMVFDPYGGNRRVCSYCRDEKGSGGGERPPAAGSPLNGPDSARHEQQSLF